MIIEICANSFESAVAAQEAGADRIELCTQLFVGGLTPSHGLIQKVVEELEIPVHVLIRPRAGDFAYSQDELDIMYRDILFCKGLGCAGVVSGVLTAGHNLDVIATKKLVEASGAMEFTFHRAIDEAEKPRQALREMMLMRVNRVLSSGQQKKALDGIPLLLEFRKVVKNQIQIMPGSGIRQSNASAFKEAGFDMIHFSGIGTVLKEANKSASPVQFNQGIEGVSTKEAIQEIMKIVGR